MTEPRQIVGSSKKPRRITAAAEAGAHALTYHGGRLIQNAEVTTIYFGPQWKSDLLKVQLDMFFDFVLTSSLIDQLAEYSSNGMTIGHGSHVASFVLETDPGPTVDNAQVQDLLGQLIAGGSVPAPNANSLYFVFLPSGTTVTLGQDASCQQFCGFHDVTPDGIVYAVDPYDDCAGCQFAPGDLLASTTVVASHELCEAITDPELDAWFDDANGEEIGDLCETAPPKVISAAGTLDAPVAVTYSVGVSPSSIVADGTTPVTLAVTLTPAGTPPPPPPPPSPGGQAWTVQKEWSNAKGACV
ncbi:MAG: hypothetical protein E6H00_13050 [Bacillati bacterium ANGP1]|uniref:Uncharacterized protein n=1 Tax=Candidatus Segetimicrobium genomatis TaxID=2569760 RepID=A0A537JXX4_9BACT|nr:MAG: hypothetical protein E6H00_13050 [Terrabacteria group bacterium ANGP1]